MDFGINRQIFRREVLHLAGLEVRHSHAADINGVAHRETKIDVADTEFVGDAFE